VIPPLAAGFDVGAVVTPARGNRADILLRFVCWAALASVALTLGALVLIICHEAWPAVSNPEKLWALLFAQDWAPLLDPPLLGIRHAILSTLMVTALSLALAVPLGFAIGLFVAELAPGWIRALLQPCFELLAGIPSVVYGFFGYVTLVAWFERYGDMATGESLFVASVVLAVMVLPFIASVSGEAFSAVPATLREAAYSTGATRWHVARRVLLRAAKPGLFAAVALGLARAVGETLAVLLLAGNSTALPTSFMDRGQPLTALIATDLPEAGVGSAKYHALYAAGLVLLVLTGAINLLVWRLKGRLVSAHGGAA
jgi:phosphate transport system permease protein